MSRREILILLGMALALFICAALFIVTLNNTADTAFAITATQRALTQVP